MDIVSNGYTDHLIISDQSPEAVALVEAIFAADQVAWKEGVTCAEIEAAHEAIALAEAAWCRAHGFKHDRVIQMALARFSEKLHRTEARHATA